MKSDTVASRLRSTIEARGVSIRSFQKKAKQAGAPTSEYASVYRYVTGKVEPPLDWIRVAAELLGVPADWLAFGGRRTRPGLRARVSNMSVPPEGACPAVSNMSVGFCGPHQLEEKPMTKSTTPEVLTVPELASRLRIGPRSAYRLCARPGFPAVRLGNLIRIPVDQLEDWLRDEAGTS